MSNELSKTVFSRFNRIWDDFTLFLFICLLVAATLQVLSRYVLEAPLPWTEELARFLLVWVAFLGSASVARRKMHITVEFFSNKFTGRVAGVVNTLLYLIMAIFLAILFYGTLVMFESSWPVHAGTMPWLRMSWVYLGAIIGVAVMLIYVLNHLVREIGNLFNPATGTVKTASGDER
jgi:TRAP-type transport system small permease protein